MASKIYKVISFGLTKYADNLIIKRMFQELILEGNAA